MICHTANNNKIKNNYEAPKSIVSSIKTNFSFINHFLIKQSNTNHNIFSKNNKHCNAFTISLLNKEPTLNLSYIYRHKK